MSQIPENGAPSDGPIIKRRPPRSPSRRQPHKSWHFNTADKIEREMQLSGYDIWGFVIYRTTYSSDADWEEFLRRLRLDMEQSFDRCNGRDILDLFKWTIFSDQAIFENADTDFIRTHFRHWSKAAAKSERPATFDKATKPFRGISARYEFCIQVDEASLRSVVYDGAEPEPHKLVRMGWVKLINKYWIPIEQDPRARPGWEADCVYEPIDGITERDVGWMKVAYWLVMTEYYYGDWGLNNWRSDYVRPPGVGRP